MRFLTFYTWGMRGDWAARLPAFREGFRALDADIVTLQETILTDHVDQAADMLGAGYHLTQQRDREDDGQGITTASASVTGPARSRSARPSACCSRPGRSWAARSPTGFAIPG